MSLLFYHFLVCVTGAQTVLDNYSEPLFEFPSFELLCRPPETGNVIQRGGRGMIVW